MTSTFSTTSPVVRPGGSSAGFEVVTSTATRQERWWCLHRSLLIRRPVSEPTASSASTARLRQIPWAGRSRTRARRPQRYVA